MTKPNNRVNRLPRQLPARGAAMRRHGRAVHPDALIFTDIIKVSRLSWVFRWQGAPDFRVYLDGVLRLTLSDNAVMIDGVDSEEPPALEVLDSLNANTAQNILYPPYLNLQWYGDATSDQYIVEENISGTWTQRAIVSETNQGYYNHQTEALTDVTEHNWRVKALTAAGNEGAAKTFAGLIVRNPPPPSVTMIYSGGTLNVIAR